MPNRSIRQFHPTWLRFVVGLASAFWGLTVPGLGAQPNPTPETDIVSSGRLTFRIYNERDGLPQNAIEGMGFDADGYLWVGTQDGAARYNGRDWSVVNLPEHTVSNFIRCLLVARDGKLWFGRQDGGLARLADGQWTNFTVRDGLPAPRVNCLAETLGNDGSSVIWAGTNGGGLASLADGKWTVHDRPDQVPHKTVTALAVLKTAESESLLVGTPDGVLKFANGRWTTLNSTAEFSGRRVSCFFSGVDFDGNPTVWAGSHDGELAFLRDGRLNSVAVPPRIRSRSISAVAQTRTPDGKRALWLGVEDAGLFRFEEGRWSGFDTTDGLPSGTVKSLLAEDTPAGTRRLWIGTDGGGLARLELNQWVTFNTATGLPVNMVFSLLVTRNPDGVETLWAGTNGKGVAQIEPGGVTVHDERSGLPTSTAFAFLETASIENKRILWAGFRGGGVARFVAGRWRREVSDFGLESATVRRLIETVGEDGKPEVWAATGTHGLARYRDGRWSVLTTADGLPTNRLFTVIEAVDSVGERQLWVGTEGGGLACRTSKGWAVFNRSNGLPNDSVLSLAVAKAPDGTPVLWAGTEGGGVVRLALTPGNRTFSVFSDTSNPALPNNTIYQVQSDASGRIYLFTNKGVARLSPRAPTGDNPAEFDLYTFSIEDGLPNNEFNGGSSFKDYRGRIWGGSIGGAVVYDPSREVPEPGDKRLILERFRVNGEPVATGCGASGSPIDLPNPLRHDENNLCVEFAFLSYFRERDTAYRFRLEGFDRGDSGWTTDHKKEYTNLAAGDYVLSVSATDATGAAIGPLTVRFTVKPAPWRTWWAYLTYGLLAGGSVWGGVRLRMRSLEQRNAALETRIAERTADLARAVDETERKNRLLETAKAQVEGKNRELDQKIAELLASQKQADRIFSALAEALPGTVLDGKYRLEEKIGAGGFGTVFRATHLTLNRPIAVKVFRPRPGNDTPEAVERFRREGVSATRVNHPNAIQVLDSGISSEGVAYIVMELLRGRSLADELKVYKRLPLKRIKEILQPVCSALAEAHAEGIIHRDIKPDNIFLHRPRDGEVVKVVDFGLAKFKEEEAADRATQGLTGSGVIIGTPFYMSPERLSGLAYDGRADVYSLGVMLYEMVCGSLPFQPSERGVIEVIMRQIHDAPQPPRRLNPKLPEAVERVILRALEKKAEMRPSVVEFEAEFTAALDGVPEDVLTEEILQFWQMETAEIQPTMRNETNDHPTDVIPPSKKTM